MVCGLLLALIPVRSMAAGPEWLGPTTVTASRDGRRLLVACTDARTITVVDTALGKPVQSIELPAEPTGAVLSPDGKMLYVTCAAPKSVVCVIRTDSGRVLDSIPVGHTAVGPAITPDGSQLFVCNRFDNDVSVIDLAARREIARVAAVREPIAAAVAPDGKSVYVVNHLPAGRADRFDTASVVTVIDTATRATRSIRLPNGSTNARGVCVSPNGKYVFVVHTLARYSLPVTQLDRGWVNTSALTVIDAAAGKRLNVVLLDEVDLGAANPWDVATAAGGEVLIVSHSGTHELSLIDAPKLLDKLLAVAGQPEAAEVPNDLAYLIDCRRRIELEGNGTRGLAVAGTSVYVAEYFTDTLAGVDLSPGVRPRGRQIALGAVPRLSPERRGEMLFHDAGISFQHWQSCASCHSDARIDGLNWDLMNDGLGNPKNTRSLLFSHKGGPAMSLGVRATAEDAVRAGILHSLFATRSEEDAEAIDAYLKSLRPIPSPYLIDGKLSPAARRGKAIFFDPKVNCGSCHCSPLYADGRLHDVGSRTRYDRPSDKFTTSRLTEVWRTAPYMHDGQYVSIKELLLKGKHGFAPDKPVPLTDKQLDDLVEFVLSL